MNHTASDFTVVAVDEAHDIGGEYARAAAAQAGLGLYAAAILFYRQAIGWFEMSRHRSAAERIAFAESEMARLDGLVAKDGQ